jgi:putative membrane protein
LEKQHVHIPRPRIQHVTILDNPLQRALGLASMRVRSAASAQRSGNVSGQVDVPIIRRIELSTLLPRLLGDESVSLPTLTARPAAARRRGIVRRIALLAVPALAALVASPPVGAVALAAAVGAGFLWGRAAHRLAGFSAVGPFTVFTAGVFRHETHLVPVARVQSARTDQSPFQRRSRLSTISCDIAGTRFAPSLYDVDEVVARDLRRSIPLATAANATPPR